MADPADGCRDGLDCSSKCVKPSETTLPGHLLELPDLDPGIFLSCHRLALTGIFQLQPWFTPQYLIPLLGMVLGNTLNGISLALDRFWMIFKNSVIWWKPAYASGRVPGRLPMTCCEVR